MNIILTPNPKCVKELDNSKSCSCISIPYLVWYTPSALYFHWPLKLMLFIYLAIKQIINCKSFSTLQIQIFSVVFKAFFTLDFCIFKKKKKGKKKKGFAIIWEIISIHDIKHLNEIFFNQFIFKGSILSRHQVFFFLRFY